MMSSIRVRQIFGVLFLSVLCSGKVVVPYENDAKLECTLDSFFLRVKQSSCECQCNGQSVAPTVDAITSVTNLPYLPTTTFRPSVSVGCSFATSSDVPVPEVDDWDRVDCYPEPGASEANCHARGCIWQASTWPNGQSTGAPWCFKPNTQMPFQVSADACAVSDNVARYSLQRPVQYQQSYSAPWAQATFAVENVGNKVLRLKIYDAAESRYEIPVPLNRPTGRASNPEYEVKVYREPYFYFQVIRKSTGAILFDTSLSGLVLEDQFLQIRTRLYSEKVYGFGENRRRNFQHSPEQGPIPMWTKDSPPTWENSNHYGFFPYYVVVESDGKAHGVLIRTSNGMEYNFGQNSKLTIKAIGGIFDFYILLADDPEELTQLYTGMVGRPFMPPYWSLGFQLSRWGYNTLPRLKTIINRNRDAGVPQDVQTLDIDHMRHRQNFIYDTDLWNGLDVYIDELKSQGIRTIIILDPAIHSDADIKHPTDPPYLPYTRGVEKDVYIKWPAGMTAPNDINVGPNNIMLGKVWPDGRAAFPDFFTDRARSWWIDEIRKTRATIKFDGLWIDMNEPANFGTNIHGTHQWFCAGGDLPGNHSCIGLTCPQTRYENPPFRGRLGRISDNTICMDLEQECRPGQMCKHYDVHNLYGWSQAEPTQTAARISTGKRSIVVSRSLYPGVGHYAGHWLGDNNADWGDLRYSIIGMMEFNLFGVPYIGADICGFFNHPSEELCARWQQVGAFYPYSRNHNGNNFPDQDPAQWPLVADVTKKALAIRYRLLPYLYTLFYHAHTNGSTVIRPIHHEFRDGYTINDQFLWGPAFMIAPIVHQGQSSRNVYFPRATWYEYNGQRSQHNGATGHVQMAIDQIGLYFRGGYIFPAQKPAMNTDQSRKNGFEFIVAVDPNSGAARGDVYWDDGESIDSVESGAYIYGRTTFTSTQTSAQFRYEATNARPFNGNDVRVTDVFIYGAPFPVKFARLDSGETATVVTNANEVTMISFSAPLKTSFTLSLSR